MSEFTIKMALTNEADDTLGSNIPCFRLGENSCSLKIIDKGLQIIAKFARHPFGKIWLSKTKKLNERSAVVCFGWCYKIGSDENQVTDSDLSEFFDEHRKMKIPDFQKYSGNYSILSYDNINKTIWIVSDKWAQMGFFYGCNSKMIVVSSKASIVANNLHANIDGYSYISLLRCSTIQPGRSLYNNVWRITCGRGIYLDAKSKKAKLVQIHPLFQVPKYSSFKEALNDFVDIVPKVCQKASSLPGTVVDLTAGNDSRLTVASLISHYGRDIENKTTFKVIGSEDDIDVIIARKISKAYNLNLICQERNLSETDCSTDFLNKAILLSDGLFLPDPTFVCDIFREKQYWKSYDNLVGSLGGELCRDFFWRHEMLNMGRSKSVNFDALLRYRLYASNDIDVKRISNNYLTIDEHNYSLLQPYKQIVEKYPDIKNVYKLDIIYLYKLMTKSMSWVYSDYRRNLLPFLTSEVTSITLRTPWLFRKNRKLVTAAVEKIVPYLSSIPSNNTQPMMPMRVSTLPNYLYYIITDYYSAFMRHIYTRRKRISTKYTIPSEWLEVLASGLSVENTFYDARMLIDNAKRNYGKNLLMSEYRELAGLLLLESLTSHFKNIKREIYYSGSDVNLTDDEKVLSP